jgi:HAD superfamily hydrolase (TIGR01509 family)
VGIHADRTHVARLIGADGKRLAREVATAAGREISEERAEGIDRHAGEVYSKLNTNPRPLPGARQLLQALERSRLPWAIATSSRAEQVSKSVESLGLARAPQVVDGGHVEHAKPAPDLLLKGAEKLRVPAHACWYIGDSTWDMVAARAATMTAVGLASGAVSAEELEHAGADTVATLPAVESELRQRGLLD